MADTVQAKSVPTTRHQQSPPPRWTAAQPGRSGRTPVGVDTEQARAALRVQGFGRSVSAANVLTTQVAARQFCHKKKKIKSQTTKEGHSKT